MNIDFALIEIESQGNDNAHGDIGLQFQAFGPLQIREPVTEDVNKFYGTNFTPEQCLGHRSISLAIFWLYMNIYCTSSVLGRTVTDEDRARIWNGGPSAWNPNSGNPEVQKLYAATTPYWQHVQKAMAGG